MDICVVCVGSTFVDPWDFTFVDAPVVHVELVSHDFRAGDCDCSWRLVHLLLDNCRVEVLTSVGGDVSKTAILLYLT